MNEPVFHAELRTLTANEFGNLLVEVELDEALALDAQPHVHSVGGLECTVLDAGGRRLVLVVPEFLVPMTAEWQPGQRLMLSGRL